MEHNAPGVRPGTHAPRTPLIITRRGFLRAGGAAALACAGAALAGCQRPSTMPVTEVSLNNERADDSATILAKDQIRVGMEAAYAPYNWQVTEPSEYTIPIDNVDGAYADGYDVQFAKIVGKAVDAEPVAVKMSFSGLIDSLNNGQIDFIIAGMSATEERMQSVDFSDPYFIGYFGLFVREDSPYRDATSLEDFSGASVLGQKDTMLDSVIDEIPGVNHVTPVDSVPNVFSRLLQGTVDAVTYNTENEEGYMKQNPGIVPIHFAEGQGFHTEVAANVGMHKGYTELLRIVNDALAAVSQDERDAMWASVLERQPE